MTANEPGALVTANVQWHLATGAAAVFVFLDDPEDPAAASLAAIPGCHVQLCDDAYWTERRPTKGRPPSQMRRQTINANFAQNRCDLEWLFHIDADEFIWQEGTLAAELATHDDPMTEVNLPVLERVFPDGVQAGLFDGSFRATSDLSAAACDAAFGPFARMMKRGQYSHGAGKSGVRVGAGLRLGVHTATRTGSEGRQRRAAKRVSTSAVLLHFDGLTPVHWVMKVLRYAQTTPEVQAQILQPHRAAQVAWLLERCATMAEARAAHRDLFALTPDRHARLVRFGLSHTIAFDPAARVGAAMPDLMPAGFDADVVRRNPWLRDVIDV
ncbi:glycosyltransferase family 2 protein [uncultured Tateyamaria sp.]|uniref:glycosyltransferase family 2 protein n=1 Tax=uncultured Tateyamaria sp. TaxID=455651 RepID=UPI0026065130|nr:glycosyltransferase family 2 protein [uncultured Tateyamaria sp.]